MISLIIPVYIIDRSILAMTRTCLNSLRHEEPDELIIVDDGSPKDYSQHFIGYGMYIRKEQNGGYASAVNAGLEDSQGDIIVVGNNDLVFHRKWLTELLKPLGEGFDLSACRTSDQKVDSGDKFGSLFAMRRKVYERIGPFDEQFRGYFSDLDYRRRALDAGFKIGKNTNLVVEHKGKATYSKTDPDDKEYQRSMRLYEIKHGFLE